ncbi:MAG: SDR family NAD(P)-dependent oxidoreductase [bacterium]|nr:SDR family NAD(P)-dependent oxidoreductase [bacterium]
MSDRLLTDKAAIVTGAGRGIGKAVALALAQEGAAVTLAARTDGELMELAHEIESLGGRALACATDVSDEKAVRRLVETAVASFGRLDIVVNNAGIGIYGPLTGMTVEQWDRAMAVNVRGPFLLCRESIPYLRLQERSCIVNISSVVGVKGYAGQSLYGASKHAVMGMSKALAKEVQSDGIRVHAVCPGGVDTAMAGQSRPDLDRSVLMQPEEIADAVLFLVTRRGKAVIDEIHLHREASPPWA